MKEVVRYSNAFKRSIVEKMERGMYASIKSKADAVKAIDEAVLLFNTKRPHLSLRFKTSDRIHFAALAA